MSDDQTGKEGSCCCSGGSCGGGAGRWIWILLALAVAGVLILKHRGQKESVPPPAVAAAVVPAGSNAVAQAKALPRLLDLGSDQCIPCKMMVPILEELRTNLAGRVEVQFIDVWENEEAGKKYGIDMIPTQIFYDAQGKELFRHEGFLGKEDILAKWKELGVELDKEPGSGSQKPQ